MRRRIDSNFAVGPNTLPFLLLLLATAAWASGGHGHGHENGHGHHVHDSSCNHSHHDKQGPDKQGHGEKKGYDIDYQIHEFVPTHFSDEDQLDADDYNKTKTSKHDVKGEKNDTSVSTTKRPELDFGRIDFRVGMIVNATKVPNANLLYVEKIDVGEDSGPRTVVSGLANHVPVENMIDRTVVVVCNLKPAKVKGITSEGMIMCATSKDGKKVEILEPPPGSLPGDIVVLEDRSERRPDKVLSTRLFKKIAKDFKTDADLQATYKGIPWLVQDWRYEQFTIGPIKSRTLINCTIY